MRDVCLNLLLISRAMKELIAIFPYEGLRAFGKSEEVSKTAEEYPRIFRREVLSSSLEINSLKYCYYCAFFPSSGRFYHYCLGSSCQLNYDYSAKTTFLMTWKLASVAHRWFNCLKTVFTWRYVFGIASLVMKPSLNYKWRKSYRANCFLFVLFCLFVNKIWFDLIWFVFSWKALRHF